MTYAVVPALRRAPELSRDFEPLLAGVLLSAATVIVSLVGIHSSVAGLIGQFFVIASGGGAIATITPRVDKAIGPRQLRDRYLQEAELTTRLVVLNTRIDLHERNEQRLFDKAHRMKIAIWLLLGSAAAIGGGGTPNVIWH